MAADAANVREELRREMREAAVRRLQQPGGVKDRVKAWQKASAAAMKEQGGGVPCAEDVRSEPTDVAVHVAAESVTEEDRVRIKMRQKPKKKKVKAEKAEVRDDVEEEKEEDKENHDAQTGDDTKRDKAGPGPALASKEPRAAKDAPKRRIVSDDNWMKRRKGKSPPPANSPKLRTDKSPAPIPKDFLQKTTQNPSVQSKIKDWVERVEITEPPRVKHSRHEKADGTITIEEDIPSTVESCAEERATPKARVNDGIRVKPIKLRKPTSDTDDSIRISSVRKSDRTDDDGIRVRPMESGVPDDGIRVRPMKSKLPDDGIRVRPIDSPSPGDGIETCLGSQRSADELPLRSASSRPTFVGRDSSLPSSRLGGSSDNVIEVIEENETELDTPTKRKVSRRRSRRAPSPSPIIQRASPADDQRSDYPATPVNPEREGSDNESERVPSTVLGNKSLADIPFGYSAFSVLDLPLGAEARHGTKKPKTQRNPSFKAMPKVLKKVVTGAKEIIQERVEPPRPAAANQPQSIESWLNDTVDPFVEPIVKDQVCDRQPTPESPGQALNSGKRPTSRPPSGSRQRETVSPAPAKKPEPRETAEQQQEDDGATPRKPKSPVTPTTGLKRRRATRTAPSPTKSGGKKPFRDLLKEAFRGESGGHKLPPTVYPSCETDYEDEGDYAEDDWESTDERRRSTDRIRRPPSPSYSSTYDSTLSSELSSHGPLRNRPPTTGAHELSTIVSEESRITASSETISTVSETTVTQTTAFTQTTDIPRQRSQKSGLKRRLTKHSDLVSVLSLPDDGQLIPPRSSKSIKSSRSLHRRPSRASRASRANRSQADELLEEFANDEHFYGRELKTLVDGVVPVLLKDVLRGGLATRNGPGRDADATAKSVVNMGMALEKLKQFHQRAPLSDINQLLTWLEAVSQAYEHYLDVWQLGFQGLIINLAPKSGRFNDDDSLLNALSLNEDGDVVGENGERVDVAYLLKRPLIRVKWMTKFLKVSVLSAVPYFAKLMLISNVKAAVAVTGAPEAENLLAVFETLQEKARKRHKEETARMTDEDANSTDTTRCRDLRNLLPLSGVLVNQMRQVVALDVFALDLHHSTGQRLECQVELIYRDNPSVPADQGDILIRQIGDDARSWLLFPPVPASNISARKSDVEQSLVVMVRGTHNGNEWFELLKLSSNSEEQLDYWMSVLGSHPVPPAVGRTPTTMIPEATSPKSDGIDIPLGESRLSTPGLESPGVEQSRTPSRYHPKPLPPSTPTSPSPDPCATISPDRMPTPTRETYSHSRLDEGRSLPPWNSPSHEPVKASRPPPNSRPYREDGAPPPPIHRTLGSNSPGIFTPPVDVSPHTRVKRRMSSPLKHEYHPSDISSDSSTSLSDDSDSSQSSSDELDEDEVPDTIPGYSIKQPDIAANDSVVSDNSLTPSNSASQVEPQGGNSTKPAQPAQRFIASVSYWFSRKGVWKDISQGEPASIIIRPGFMEVHELSERSSNHQAYPLQSSGTSEVDNTNKDAGSVLPLVGLVLTPVVMIRRSTALDLEVRSPASPESRLKIEGGMFRFRAATQAEAKNLYEAVHLSRLNNARYIQLSEEARFRSFGQAQPMVGDGSADDDSSSRRRTWFGRKNSYRASTRAPSVSQGSISTTISAGSFLRRLMGGGNTAFNIDESTVDKQSRPGSVGAGGGSLYTSSASSSGGGASTPPRSVSASLSGSGSRWSNGLAKPFSPDRPLEIRCHLNVQNNRWLDKGDCILHITRPPPGVRQELSLYHGLEKRIIVTHATKKSGSDKDKPLILLDAVLGSKCFSMLGSKGVMCSVWENLRDEEGNVGVAPRNGAVAGKVTKWCFQCKSMQQANWIMGMVTSEVPGLMMG
jgi:hypothetical protein